MNDDYNTNEFDAFICYETKTGAGYATHIGICVRSAADLMGYFTHFEHGNRTDAIIKDNNKNDGIDTAGISNHLILES